VICLIDITGAEESIDVRQPATVCDHIKAQVVNVYLLESSRYNLVPSNCYQRKIHILHGSSVVQAKRSSPKCTNFKNMND
jgi:hypothetical protein